MRLEYLAKMLEDASLGKIGDDIFVGHMPSECQKGILLKDPLVGTPADPNLPGYYKSKLQLVVRAPTRFEGDNIAKEVGKAMTIYNREFFDLDGNLELKVNHIYPAQLPIVYPYTPGNTIEWSLNFVTSYVQVS